MNIEFLILQQSEARQRYLCVCQQAALFYAEQKTVYIHCADEMQAQQIDALLWSFDDISFVPHDKFGTQAPVQLGYQDWPVSPAMALINLAAAIPPEPQQYQQIIEIVSQDPEIKNLCRQHYKAYQAAGFTVKSRDL
jgi:DNA polymerase-3 subunit chi